MKLGLALFLSLIIVHPVFSTDQFIHSGGQGIIHSGSGDIIITGYSKEEHRKALEQLHTIQKENLSLMRQDLEQVYLAKTDNLRLRTQILEKELADSEQQLKNLSKSYDHRILLLQDTITKLRLFQGKVDDTLLLDAELALKNGDTSKADKLFKKIEDQEQRSIERAAAAAFQRGKIAQDEINFLKAFQHYKRAVTLLPNNLEYLTIAGSMAGIVADHSRELEWKQQSLKLYIELEGINSPAVSTMQNNLATAYVSLGQYEKAIEYYKLALTSDLKTFGKSHPNVAKIRSNLGLASDALGQYEKAIEYHELALASDLKTYGEGHAIVARDYNNLGVTYKSLGQYEKAIEYYSLALSGYLNKYSADHPKVAIAQNNLGVAYDALGRYEKAIEYYELALATDLKALGEDHPTVAIDRNNLGVAYNSLGKHEKAIEYLKLSIGK